MARNSTRAAVLTITPEQIVEALADLVSMVQDYTQQEGKTSKPAAAKSASKKAVEKDEEQDTYSAEEIAAMGIKDLRALAVELELDAQKVKNDIIDELTEKGYIVDDDEDEDELEDEEEDDEDDEGDEEEDDEDEGYSREDLEEMTLAQLRKLAKDEGLTVPRGADQDALVDLILGEDEDEDDEDDDEEDEAEDDDTDSDSDDDEDEEITEDEIKEMSLKELVSLAKELELKVTVPRSAKTDASKQKVYVKAILDSVGEDDE